MTLARGGLILIGAAAGFAFLAIALAFAGQAVGIGSQGTGGVLVIAISALLGIGSATLAVANSSPVLRSRAVRGSLVIFSVGALMESVAALGSLTSATDGLESMPLVILMVGGGVVMLLGVAALSITVPIARRRSPI